VTFDLIQRDPDSAIAAGPADFCRLADAFIASRDVSESSRMTYRRALKAFFDWLSSSGRFDKLGALGRFDILAYKEHLCRGRRVATANLYLFIVRGFFTWLNENRLYGNITSGVASLKKLHGHARDLFTAEQVRLILGGIDRITPQGKRDYAIVNLMARTGLRDIEVASARVGDIGREADEMVLWVQGKGRREADAFVVLLPKSMDAIREWWRRSRS
jgi:integrase/recombinase XerD